MLLLIICLIIFFRKILFFGIISGILRDRNMSHYEGRFILFCNSIFFAFLQAVVIFTTVIEVRN